MSSHAIKSQLTGILQPTGGVLLLFDHRPNEPIDLLEIRSRKSVTQPAGQSAQAGDGLQEVGGAAAAVITLNAEDDDTSADAPVPEPFEYNTDNDG